MSTIKWEFQHWYYFADYKKHCGSLQARQVGVRVVGQGFGDCAIRNRWSENQKGNGAVGAAEDLSQKLEYST